MTLLRHPKTGLRSTRRPRCSSAIGLLTAALATTGPADAAGVPGTPEVTVIGARRAAGASDSAGDGTVLAEQLQNRPMLRPAEMLETVPGMIVTQHSGDGKANQYFLRGFNLDHGSDFATRVLGMPVNVTTHGHGQGYMDLNFLLPELVRTVRYRKGPYAAEDGDFAVTGSAQIDLVRRVERPQALFEVGAHDYRRALGMASTPLGGWQWLAAVQTLRNDGPWTQPERLNKSTGVLRASRGDAADGIAVTLMAYDARWNATEHVPERAIARGEIGRYGALLPGDGGRTHRHSLSLEFARPDDEGRTRAEAWVIDYGLNLFSAPSGFIRGPEGDQHEQEDHRRTLGGRLSRQQGLGEAATLEIGLQLRDDRVPRLGLYDTVSRVRTEVVRSDALQSRQWGAYAEWRQAWSARLRSTLGLRLDDLRATVTAQGGSFNAANGGTVSARQWSPKLGLAAGPFGNTELFANWGRGFHGNDARGATTRVRPDDGSAVTPVPLQVPATGGEVGLRTTLAPGWQLSLDLWWLRLGSELVFIGDEGVTEPRGASRRMGVEASLFSQPLPGWTVDADIAASRARFVEPDPQTGGRFVPNAIPWTASTGVTFQGNGRWSGGLRLRWIGRYALESTGTERSSPSRVLNLDLGWHPAPDWRLGLQLLNLTGSRANDIEYWGAACTRSEGAACSAAGGIDGRLVHPLEPRTLRLNARLQF